MLGGRLALLLGALAAIAGSFGLFFYSPSVVEVFDVLTHDPGQPPGAAFTELPYAAIAGLCFGVGAALAAIGLGIVAKRRALSGLGRLLIVLAGVAGMVAGAALLVGAVTANRGFASLASAATTPETAQIRALVNAALPPVTFGFSALAASPLFFFFTGLAGFGRQPAREGGCCLAVGTLGLAVLGCLGFAVLFLMIFLLEGRALESAAVDPLPRPSDLAAGLSGILRNLMGAGGCLIAYGLGTALAGLLLPGRRNG
jgi:hypothetical protein